jgi:serine protease Do
LAEPALSSGDILRAIGGRPTSDLAALVEIYERIMDTDPVPDHVLVRFDRRGKDLVTLLKPKPDEDVDPPREVRKAWIGIATQPVLGPLARKLGHPDRLGYRIARVYPRTLAAEADLAIGDVILALNGERLKPRGMQDSGLLARKVRQLDFDRSATLTILRDEAPRDVTVALERSRRTRAEARRDRNRDFELTVREVTFFDRDDRRWDDRVRGVLVEQVESAGWAGLGGIQRGDLIQEIDGHSVRGLKSYRSAMESATQAQRRRVIFVVLRGVRTRFQYVEPDWKPVLADKGKEETHVD